jgi:hypothetical protein
MTFFSEMNKIDTNSITNLYIYSNNNLTVNVRINNTVEYILTSDFSDKFSLNNENRDSFKNFIRKLYNLNTLTYLLEDRTLLPELDLSELHTIQYN